MGLEEFSLKTDEVDEKKLIDQDPDSLFSLPKA